MDVNAPRTSEGRADEPPGNDTVNDEPAFTVVGASTA